MDTFNKGDDDQMSVELNQYMTMAVCFGSISGF